MYKGAWRLWSHDFWLWRCNSYLLKSAIPGGKVKKGTVHKAIIVRTKKEILRPDGSTIQFDSNSVVLVNKQNEPIGSRVFGPVPR